MYFNVLILMYLISLYVVNTAFVIRKYFNAQIN